MGYEAKSKPSSTPKLPLFSIQHLELSEPSGMLTPPLQTSASVPFRWEEEPGKPRPCTALITTLPNNNNNTPKKCLELPPRLLLIEAKITKTPSPTTVLDCPDYVGKSVFSLSSFRFSRDRRQGSFDSTCSSRSPTERGQLLGPMVLGKGGQKGRGLFGSFRLGALKLKGGKKEICGGSSVISSSSSSSSMDMAGYGDYDEIGPVNTGKKTGSIRRNGSFSNLSHVNRSHFWASIYEGFKQVVPWKSRKSKKEDLII